MLHLRMKLRALSFDNRSVKPKQNNMILKYQMILDINNFYCKF